MKIKLSELKKLKNLKEEIFLHNYEIELEDTDENNDPYFIECNIDISGIQVVYQFSNEDYRDDYDYYYSVLITDFKIKDVYCTEIKVSNEVENELIELIEDYIKN